MRFHKVVCAVTALAFGMLVSACGDDSHKSDNGPTDETSLTASGTSLHFGDTARVSPKPANVVFDVTVTGVSKAPAADMIKMNFKNSSTKDAYYVTYKFTLVSGDPNAKKIRDYLNVYTSASNSDLAVPLHIYEPFPACQERDFSRLATAGTSVTSCGVYLVKKGSPAPDRVMFYDLPNYDLTTGDDIEWK